MASCDEAMKKLIFLAMTSKDYFDCIKRIGERLAVIRNKLDNYNPSCRICNHYKRATRLEIWRTVFLGELLNRIKKIYIVKVAERYGMITFHEWDKKFYFEREIKENEKL